MYTFFNDNFQYANSWMQRHAHIFSCTCMHEPNNLYIITHKTYLHMCMHVSTKIPLDVYRRMCMILSIFPCRFVQ